ncbi:MAG: nucleotidyltransferase [Lentisphaeria bacterium]|nr:nucleotidyltransferase [Lentisphaeria bacterium]
MTAPTLLVLAAGMGSRYGGIKQMDPVGAHGEFVLDYSMYDAWRAGFETVVLVIRPELEAPLREHFGDKLAGKLEIRYAHQVLGDLPPGIELPAGREKPWGTGHAVRAARHAVDGPFAVINADDFYGTDAYRIIGEFLKASTDPKRFCMVAYRLRNTLSRHGSVSRGICTAVDGMLQEVVERTSIELLDDDGVRFLDDAGTWQTLTGEEPCSLNLWGFTPLVFEMIEQLFTDFLAENLDAPKTEFYIPTVVDTLIKQDLADAEMLQTDEQWFGMTYHQDRALVVEKLIKAAQDGIYPSPLWS